MDDFKNWQPLNTHAQETQPNDSKSSTFHAVWYNSAPAL